MVSSDKNIKSGGSADSFSLLGVLSGAGRRVRNGFLKFIDSGTQKFTVMLIPHSEKKVFNFKISIFSIVFFCFILCGIFGAFIVFSTRFSGMSNLLYNRTESLEQAETRLGTLLDEMELLSQSFNVLAASVNNTFETIGLESANAISGIGQDGDLANFLGESVQTGLLSSQLNIVQAYADSMAGMAKRMDSINRYLENESDLLQWYPNIWPVKDGIGYETHKFNLREDPFTKEVYFHKGYDIANHGKSGTEIVATANGKVIEVKNDILGGYGYTIEIQHKFGWRTRYAHLQDDIPVQAGDIVAQGDTIGYMGNSGRSTAPHLHYEVKAGTEVVDPEYFLHMKK